MLLDRVLEEIRHARGPIDLGVLSRRLGASVRAIEGMLDTLEMKGVIERPRLTVDGSGMSCSGPCGSRCHGPESCAFTVRLGEIQPIRLLTGID